MPKLNHGICAGGPVNGHELVSDFQSITIPIRSKIVRWHDGGARLEFDSGQYLFHPLLRMWIWQGKWNG